MNAQQRRLRFRDNIKRLMEDRGLTARDVAVECDLPLKWVKRACEGGLDRQYVRNEKKLTKPAAVLGLSHPKEFWRETPSADLLTEIRDEWTELAGSPFEEIAEKELKACHDACRDLVRCGKVYNLLCQMPGGAELAEMYRSELGKKDNRTFWKSIEAEADFQRDRLTEQLERRNLKALIDRVRQMENGEAIVERIQKSLDRDPDRVYYRTQRTRTMREFWQKVVDTHGEEYAADWLYRTYSQITPNEEQSLRDFFATLEAFDTAFADFCRREAENPVDRDGMLYEIKRLGVERAAQEIYQHLHKDWRSENLPEPQEEFAPNPASTEDDPVDRSK